MNLIIEEAPNGFILRDANTGRPIKVITEPEQGTDAEALATVGAALLWSIIDLYGMYGNKYDATRVRVTLEPGYYHSEYHDYIRKEYGIDMADESGVYVLPADLTWWQRFWGWIWTR
jgi:hypothetical protein